MERRPRVYLAGPDVFRPDAVQIGIEKKAICADYGFEGLYPSENTVDLESPDAALQIFRANVLMMQSAELGILDLTPFRGPSADAGTVFELGFLVSRNVPVFAYTAEPAPYRERVAGKLDPATRQWFDPAGDWIEDFGNADNLMIEMALREQGRPLIRVTHMRDHAGLRACLDRAAKDFGLRHAA